jgi:hypothetical protein
MLTGTDEKVSPVVGISLLDDEVLPVMRTSLHIDEAVEVRDFADRHLYIPPNWAEPKIRSALAASADHVVLESSAPADWRSVAATAIALLALCRASLGKLLGEIEMLSLESD